MTAQITWALCPNGVDPSTSTLRFSVFVSPTITAITDLGSAPWPLLMQAMTPSLVIGTTTIPLTPSMLDTSVMNAYPGAWAALFGASPPVSAPAAPNYAGNTILSYDSHEASANLHAAYQELAANTIAPKPVITKSPTTQALMNQANYVMPAARTIAPAIRNLPLGGGGSVAPVLSSSGGSGVLPKHTIMAVPFGVTPPSGEPLASFVYAALLHNRANLRQAPPISATTPPATPALPDFHDVMAQLVDQPEVLRALGIILDYAVPMSLVPAAAYSAASSTTTARFSPGSSAPGTQTTPATVCVVSATAFYASAPASSSPASEVDRGVLTIDDGNWLVEQLELDHAVSTVTTAAANTNTTSTEPQSLPALQSTGFTVLRSGRDAALSARMAAAQASSAAGSSAQLAADALVRGYRVDVSSDGVNWTSLCKRTGSVTLGAGASAVTINLPTPATPSTAYPSARDEGFVKASAPTIPNDSPGLLQLHESVFGWHGWSLAARHPAHAIDFGTTAAGAPQAVIPAASMTQNQSPAGSAFQVAQTVTPQIGSIPTLRYGKQYSFRARVADLAGNSVPLSTTTTHVSPLQTFCRYDPALTPTLVPLKKITEGEALERLVIRSQGNDAGDATAMAAQLNADLGTTGLSGSAIGGSTSPDTSATTTRYFSYCQRHVAPPKVAEIVAEQHGMLDALMVTNPAAAFAVASKNGSFLTPQPGWYFVDPKNTATPIWTTTPPYIAQGQAPPEGSYVFIDYPTSAIELPYLPDPIASGVQISTSQDISYAQPAMTTSNAYSGTWPNVEPFPLVLQDSEGAPASMSNSGNAIAVSLPPGTQMWIDYSSTIPASALPLMGWYQELIERPSAAASLPAALATVLTNIGAAATAGTHWMFTPKRTIHLVHATLQPVQAPSLSTLSVTRNPLSTAPSTAIPNATYAYVNGIVTAHPQSTAHVDLQATWNEWDDNSGAWIPHAARVASTQFDYDDGPLPVTDYKQEFGDTKARQITYTPVATTRYKEYFPTSLTSNPASITLSGAGITQTVLSTRQPPAPHPLYVIPSFLRTEGTGTSVRSGSTLRVYVNRPWFESGVGEQLAIVCQPASPPSGATPVAYSGVSQIGWDPMWGAEVTGTGAYAQPQGMLASAILIDGSGRMALHPNQTLPDGTVADLVVFNVDRSDPATDGRGLFFVDISLPSSQFQLVSFQLARYQPNTITNPSTGLPIVPAISGFARAAFTRVQPDRAASVAATATTVTLSVTGASASLSPRPLPTTTGGLGGGGGGSGGGGGGGGHTIEAKNGATSMITPVKTVQPTPAQYAANGSFGRYIQATLESTTNPVPADTDNELGWQQGASVVLTPTTGSGSDPYVEVVTWTGSLPISRVSGTRYRVVLREFEIHNADPATALPQGTASWMGNFAAEQSMAWAGTPAGCLDTLVYSDILSFT